VCTYCVYTLTTTYVCDIQSVLMYTTYHHTTCSNVLVYVAWYTCILVRRSRSIGMWDGVEDVPPPLGVCVAHVYVIYTLVPTWRMVWYTTQCTNVVWDIHDIGGSIYTPHVACGVCMISPQYVMSMCTYGVRVYYIPPLLRVVMC